LAKNLINLEKQPENNFCFQQFWNHVPNNFLAIVISLAVKNFVSVDLFQ
jgi:hypothetical protein